MPDVRVVDQFAPGDVDAIRNLADEVERTTGTAPWLGIIWPPSAAAMPWMMGLPARSASSPLARPKATEAMALPWHP